MSSLQRTLVKISAELRSEKLQTRNKAAEQLDKLLKDNKKEVIELFRQSRSSMEFSYNELLKSVIEAIIGHTIKVQESRDEKSAQQLRNKNFVFRGIMTNIIDYHLEGENYFLSKSCLFAAFVDGFTARCTIKYFGTTFLDMLERGIYKTVTFIPELRVNEYSRILSYLFEASVDNDDVMRFAILSAIIKTLDLAIQHVQIGSDLIDYLPEIDMFAKKANVEQRRADVIKLFYIFVSQLAVDYHLTMCTSLQNQISSIITFYQYPMKTNIKEQFFHAVYLTLIALNPHLNTENEISVAPKKESQPTYLGQLHTIVEKEVKAYTTNKTNKTHCVEPYFVKMAAVVTYLKLWRNKNSPEISPNSRGKIRKEEDKLEILLLRAQPDKLQPINTAWLAILTEIVHVFKTTVDALNIHQIIQSSVQMFEASSSAQNVQYFCPFLTSLLQIEKRLILENMIAANYCFDMWNKLVQIIKSNLLTNMDVMAENQKLLLALLTFGKLSSKDCTALLDLFISNSPLKRNECIRTVHKILSLADDISFHKNSEIVERIIKWLYDDNEKQRIQNALHGVSPIDEKLVAETGTLAVVNFLEGKRSDIPSTVSNKRKCAENINLFFSNLAFKQNQRLVCLDLKIGNLNEQMVRDQEQKTCLFQNNYNLLMRTVNFQPSLGSSLKSALVDLLSLNKIVLVMKFLIEFGIFDETNLMQCHLIKRMGLFLNQLKFQLTKNNLENCDDVAEIMHPLDKLFGSLMSNPVLISYLETESLEELINFVGHFLKLSASRNYNCESEDWVSIARTSISILSRLCGTSSHYKGAFGYIIQHEMVFPNDADTFLKVAQILSRHRCVHFEIGEWVVHHLKILFKRCHTDINIIKTILILLPEILIYLSGKEDHLQSMYIAMASMLKIAYKKSYSVEVTVSIIQTLQIIAQNCLHIHLKTEFLNICLMALKFLSVTTLSIQLTSIELLAVLIKVNNSNRGTPSNEKIFFGMLNSELDWKNQSIGNVDLAHNTVSVTLQALCSFVVFSKYHKLEALKAILNLCALRKFKKDDFSAFRRISYKYGCSLSTFYNPFIKEMIHNWIAKNHSIREFPYFLCFERQDDFISQNLPEVITCLLIYGKPEDFKSIKEYVSNNIFKVVSPKIKAFLLPYECKCPEADANGYNQKVMNLKENIEALNFKFLETNVPISNWETIYHVMSQMEDKQLFENTFADSVPAVPSEWYYLSFTSIQRVLTYNIDKKHGKIGLLEALVSETPLDLFRVLQDIQRDCMSCLFSWEKMKLFHAYSALVDFSFDLATQNSGDKKAMQGVLKFFVRDAILFSLNFSLKAQGLDVKKIGLVFVNNILRKPQIIKECKKVIESYLNEVCRSIVSIVEESQCHEIEKISIETIRYLIVQNKEEYRTAILLLDEFPPKNCYEEFRELIITLRNCQNRNQIESKILNSYIESCSRGVGGVKEIRQYIQKHKAVMQNDNDTLYNLVKKLITAVRTSNKWEMKNECAICLGDIGSLKIKNFAYYFQSESANYEIELILNDPLKYFHISLMRIIEELLLDFNPKIYKSVFEVAEKVTNSECGSSLIDCGRYLHVFSSKNQTRNFLDNIANCTSINWVQILKSTLNSVDYKSWICCLMAEVYKSVNWKAFQEVAYNNANFADMSLLPFIKNLIVCEEKHLPNLLAMLEYFFEEFVQIIGQDSVVLKVPPILKDKRIIRKLLDICECIRTSNNRSLTLNFINLCQASNYCQAFFMSILYLELYYLHEEDNIKTAGNKLLENRVFQKVALKAYESIGCNDALSVFVNPCKSRVEYLNLKNCWSDALIEAASFELSPSDLYRLVLKRNGIFLDFDIGKNTQSIDYEMCWRLCQWDVPLNSFSKPSSLTDMEQEFQKHHYCALICLKNQEKNSTLDALSKARHCVISILDEISIECLQSVYKYLNWLQLLRQIEDFCEVQFFTDAHLDDIFRRWKAVAKLDYGNFRHKEEILSHQITVFHTAGVRAKRKVLEIYKVDPVEICLLNCVTLCKKAGEINLAKRNIAKLREKGNISSKLVKINMLLEDAEICFDTGKPEITKSILDFVLQDKELQCLYTVRAIILYGNYLLETNSQIFENVLSNNFIAALKHLDTFSEKKNILLAEYDGFLDLVMLDEFEHDTRKCAYKAAAEYADKEYIQLNIYIKSDEFEIRKKIIQQNREDADSITKHNRDRDKLVGANFLRKNAALDEREMHSFQSKCTRNLCTAINYYIQFCCIDEKSSDSIIYRIIALWFSNKDDETLCVNIENKLQIIPSYKFLCALNQMTGRLNSKNKTFLKELKNILIKCVQDHPHHTLYKLYPLVYAFSDGAGNTANDRVDIAKEIISKGQTEENSNSIRQLEIIFPALIEFANVEFSTKSKNASCSLNERIKKLKNMNAVQCPTINLLPSPNLKYDIISIVKWESTVSFVGGINSPKKLMCVCSDGVSRPQLLKGKDDLRQDAVMQQVFAIINNLLTNDPETSERRLTIRTYTVVPLSMRSGILEWCENTIPLGQYLIATHEKYRPKDFTVKRCRNLSMQHLRSDAAKRLEIFNTICENIHPVMHYFLLDKFLVPGVWFERRLAYTNSVATTSIVGFILGLGDRHTQNILIDEKTAEHVHIDFGIAFEQGKIMPTPETVPFRLTRDIVAPLGICKTGGIFKISCEATMQILRRHRSVIITILEVLLFDPLYMWKVLQRNTNEETNLTAQRTLLCVQNKLEGRQDGILSTCEVNVQVQRLINEARSANNLCQLYPGWDPYL